MIQHHTMASINIFRNSDLDKYEIVIAKDTLVYLRIQMTREQAKTHIAHINEFRKEIRVMSKTVPNSPSVVNTHHQYEINEQLRAKFLLKNWTNFTKALSIVATGQMGGDQLNIGTDDEKKTN